MNKHTAPLALVALSALLTFGAHAQDAATDEHASHGATHAPAASDAGAAVMTSGEVVRVNLAAGKLTIRHEAIANLNMPAMSMVFTLKDPAQINGLKEGDKVRFHVERENGAMVITNIQPAAN